jgi:hypothetical protein
MTEHELVSTTDATIWVQEWLKTIKEHPGIPTDEDAMLGWFANAIMAGWDESKRNTRDRLLNALNL